MNIRIAFILLILAVAASAASKIKVACVGNSITAGNSMYPPYLQTLLGSGYQVENDGVGGTTLLKKGDMPYWTRGKLNQALAFNPDIVTIKLGTNDTKFSRVIFFDVSGRKICAFDGGALQGMPTQSWPNKGVFIFQFNQSGKIGNSYSKIIVKVGKQ